MEEKRIYKINLIINKKIVNFSYMEIMNELKFNQ